MSKRIVVVQDGGSDQKFVNVTDGMTFAEFLSNASQKLGINGKRAFTNKGVEVEDVDILRDDDVLTITEGNAPGEKKKKGPAQQQFKIAVIGSGGVGKSAITLQYVQGRFIVEYDPTIEDAYRKQIKIDNEVCVLDILDTAGQEDYVALRGQWMQDRDGFILVYSVTDRRTFEDVDGFHQQLKQIHDKLPPLVILGNKCDVTDEQRTVSKFEGEQLAKAYRCSFLESSAKEGINIEPAFTTVVREIRKRSGTSKQKKGFCQIL